MRSAKQVHDEMMRAFGVGDMATLVSLFSPSCVVREAPGLPFGGDYVGHEGLSTLFSTLGDAFDIVPTLLDVYEVSDSLVISNTSMRMTSRQTGESVDMPVLEMFTVRDGLIVEAVPFYWDTEKVATMAAQASSGAS